MTLRDVLVRLSQSESRGGAETTRNTKEVSALTNVGLGCGCACGSLDMDHVPLRSLGREGGTGGGWVGPMCFLAEPRN